MKRTKLAKRLTFGLLCAASSGIMMISGPTAILNCNWLVEAPLLRAYDPSKHTENKPCCKEGACAATAVPVKHAYRLDTWSS